MRNMTIENVNFSMKPPEPSPNTGREELRSYRDEREAEEMINFIREKWGQNIFSNPAVNLRP